MIKEHKNIHNAGTGGFTLLELTAAISLWIILLVGASRLLWYSTHVSTDLIARQEALENARVAVDALSVNIKMADVIDLHTIDGMLRQLDLRQIRPDGTTNNYRFLYDSSLPSWRELYNRLHFGNLGNPIALHLSAVKLELSEDLNIIHITVTTNERLGTPITLSTSVDIRYKTLIDRRR